MNSELIESLLVWLLFTVATVSIIVIFAIYFLFRVMRIQKTVVSPLLYVGPFLVLQGITELFEHYFGEAGKVAHLISMILTTLVFTYGCYTYYRILRKAGK